MNNTIKVGISVGDLNGIGAEVILKTFEDSRILELCTPIVFANVKIISFIKKGLSLNLAINGIDKIEQAVPNKFNVLNTWREGVNLNPGVVDEAVGKYAIKSFVEATSALKNNTIDVLVTAPINKYNIQSETFAFPGHTDYLDKELEGNALMLMTHQELRVGLVTDHVAVKDINSHINASLIEKKVKVLKKTLIRDFGISKPKIAVLGLNPHNGDQGIIGKEDQEVIIPTLQKIYKEGTMVFGPFAADGFFGAQNYKNYDAVLAMYHDQGLIPFKTLSFGEGVNFTAGLEKIRTSPDHGTGFDIANKGIADESSFKAALYLAIDVFRKREEHNELVQNPLQNFELSE